MTGPHYTIVDAMCAAMGVPEDGSKSSTGRRMKIKRSLTKTWPLIEAHVAEKVAGGLGDLYAAENIRSEYVYPRIGLRASRLLQETDG